MQISALIAGPMKESREDHVTLAALSSADLEPVLDFVYGGSLTLNKDNIEDIIAVASYLQIRCVLECCCDFMTQTLSVGNCVDYLILASNYGLDSVVSHVARQDSVIECIDLFILENISDLCLSNIHVRIPRFETMRKLVSSDRIKIGELNLYSAVTNWLKADPSRMQYCEELMEYIRFMLIPLPELVRLQAHPDYDSIEVREKIEQALNYISMPVTKKIQWESRVDQIRGKPSATVIFGVHPRKKKCVTLNVLLESCDDYDDHSDSDNDEKDSEQNQTNRESLWVEMMYLPDKFARSSVACFKNFLFVCGGSDRTFGSHAYRECHVFDPVTWQWDKIAPMNVGRCSFPLVVHKEELYAIGGRIQNDDCTDSIEKYSLRDNCWQVVAHYHVPAAHVAAVSATGLLYMYGGETDYTSEVRSFCSLDTLTNERKFLPLCPGEDVRYGECTLLCLQNYLCVLCPHDSRCDDMICFNIDTQQWVRFSFDVDIFDLDVFLVNERSIYCLGGSQNLRFAPDIENNYYREQNLPESDNSEYYASYARCCWLTIPYERILEAQMKADIYDD